MFIEVKIPEYPLRSLVRSIIYYKDYSARCNYEMLLPDGCSQLIIALDDEERFLENIRPATHKEKSFKKYWITGIQTKPVVYLAEKGASALCVQFENGGLHTLFGAPATEFRDEMVDASLIMPQELNVLREKLLKCQSTNKIMETISGFLGKRLLNCEKRDLRLVSFVTKMMCEENYPLYEVVRQTGYSQKHLIHKFKTTVGVTPKRYQRLFRFNKALNLMQHEVNIDFSDLAFQCNYFDQAHFINDFNEMSAGSPTQYLSVKKDYPHVLPLNALR